MMQFIMNQKPKTMNERGSTFGSTAPQHIKQVTQYVAPKEIEPKKMAWGEPIWFLFHTLAEKVKQDHFSIVRKELLDTIYSICRSLPCPTCAEHASSYLNGINFNTLRTKEELKQMLFDFHNEVNAKKGFPLFLRSDLDEKYSKANTLNIIQHFMIQFKNKHKSIRMIANDFYRSNLIVVLKAWFNENIQHFDL